MFKGRYKAILIAEEAYLAQVSRYIHRNPVEAKLVKEAKDYPWSSYPAYCSPEQSPPWLLMNEAIMRVSPRCNRDEYLQFVNNPLVPSMHGFYRSKQLPGILGSKESRRLVENHTGYHREWKPIQRIELDQIIELVAEAFSVSKETILLSKRGSPNRARASAMYLANSISKYPASELAVKFGVGSSGIAQTIWQLKKVLSIDPELSLSVKNLKEMVMRV